MPVSSTTAMAWATFSSVRWSRSEREYTITETLLSSVASLERNTRSWDTRSG